MNSVRTNVTKVGIVCNDMTQECKLAKVEDHSAMSFPLSMKTDNRRRSGEGTVVESIVEGHHTPRWKGGYR